MEETATHQGRRLRSSLPAPDSGGRTRAAAPAIERRRAHGKKEGRLHTRRFASPRPHLIFLQSHPSIFPQPRSSIPTGGDRTSGQEALNRVGTRRNGAPCACAFGKRRQPNSPVPCSSLCPAPLDTGMQNPSGNHNAPAAAAAGKSKSSAQATAAAASGHGHQPSPATPAAAKSKSSSQAAAGAHSSPATPATSKSKSSAHAAPSGQVSSSHHHHTGGGAEAAASSLKRKRGVFQKDLQHMMYGFGDDPNPLPETVALVEDIVVEYVTDLRR